MRTVGLYTLGCKVSQYETEAIRECFVERGFTPLDFAEVCDVYVINTCTVTSTSDAKSRQMIRRAIARNPLAVVAVVGCYSQRDAGTVARIEGVDIVLGTSDKLSVVDRVIEVLDGRVGQYVSAPPLDGIGFEPMTIHEAPRTRAYVKIEDGCECKCTYCAISGARGPVRSKRPEDVISEVEGLYRSGVREIVLTGIETGSYGRDFDTRYRLSDLIVELDRRHSAERIRLGSLAPELVGREFALAVAKTTILAPHFHLSMQSGSNSVLRRMKRRYTREMAIENISALREVFPRAQFTTDLMVGFPGESEDEFLDTVSLVREVGFLDAHIFAYSRRAGTPAATYDGQIDEALKRERSARLISVALDVRERVLREIVSRGEPLTCILESYDGRCYIAHSDEFCEVSVVLPEGMTGERVMVRPVSSKSGIIYGEPIL